MADRLPVEIITHILQYLSVSDRKEAALVSRLWYEASLHPVLSRNTITKVQLHSSSSLQGCPNLPHRRLLHVALEHIDNSFYLRQLGEHSRIMFEELISLSLKGSQMSESVFVELMRQCPKLESLDLTGCNSLFMSGQLLVSLQSQHGIQALTNLQELNLSSLRYLADSTFNRLMVACPSVKKLSLAGCQVVFHTDSYFSRGQEGSTAVLTFKNILNVISSRSQQVKSLNFSRTSIADDHLIAIANVEGLGLEEICLVNCQDVTIDGIRHFCKKQHTIQGINLSECQDVSDGIPSSIAQHLSGVRKVELKKCRQLTNLSIERFSSLDKLEHVDISECYNVSSDGVIKGLCLPSHTSLTHINVSGCVGIKDSFVTALCKTLLHVEHLDLGSCHSITDLSVHKISKYLHSLVYLRLAWCHHITDYGLLGLVDENAKQNHDEEGLCRCTRKSNVKNVFNKPTMKPKTVSEKELLEREYRAQSSCHEDEGFSISSLSRLRELDLTSCPKVTNVSLKHATKFDELRKLSVAINQNVDDESLVAIATNIPTLEHLDIGQCGRVTDDGVTFAALYLKRLSYLNVYSCDLLTDAVIQSLQDHSPRLRHLDVSLCSGITMKAVSALERSLKGMLTVKTRLIGANGQII